MKKTTLLFVLFFATASTFAQKSNYGNWLMYFGNQKINKKFNWHNEVQYRSYNIGDDLEQLLLRTGLGYNLTNNNNNILMGYGFIRSGNYNALQEKNYTSEHRLFQQFITRHTAGRVAFQHRYRIEERFLKDDFKVRFRYFLGLNIPLNKTTMTNKTIYASLYNEIFINAQSPIFDRNRLYGAIGYVINNDLKVEVGTMSQMQETKQRLQFQIGFYNSIPFSKS